MSNDPLSDILVAQILLKKTMASTQQVMSLYQSQDYNQAIEVANSVLDNVDTMMTEIENTDLVSEFATYIVVIYGSRSSSYRALSGDADKSCLRKALDDVKNALQYAEQYPSAKNLQMTPNLQSIRSELQTLLSRANQTSITDGRDESTSSNTWMWIIGFIIVIVLLAIFLL